ncbi:hypothetical protein NC653_006065 [Populus alba x Populus x berolinensis]|uniref:Uncharacterized protein n=1 Tax=Populus alba x Populus x berolinensis TaxID=444605 RepID=A0AAD6WCM0_9ROSI|nr:hypothetical protein NC653_006065 [Populus alba x Populus x berolinensis]
MADHVADVVKEVAEKMGKVAEEVADHLLEGGKLEKSATFASGDDILKFKVEGRHGKKDRSRLFKKSQWKPITYPKKQNTGEPGKNDKCNLFDRC